MRTIPHSPLYPPSIRTVIGLLLCGLMLAALPLRAQAAPGIAPYDGCPVPRFSLLLDNNDPLPATTLLSNSQELYLLDRLVLQLHPARQQPQPVTAGDASHRLLSSLSAELLLARDLGRWLPLAHVGLQLGAEDVQPLPTLGTPTFFVGYSDSFGVKLSPLSLLVSLDQNNNAACTLQFSVSW